MSIRYSLFGIPATLDEFLEKASIKRQDTLAIDFKIGSRTWESFAKPIAYEANYRIFLRYSDLTKYFVVEKDRILLKRSILEASLGIEGGLENKEAKAKKFLSRLPSRIEHWSNFLKDNGFSIHPKTQEWLDKYSPKE